MPLVLDEARKLRLGVWGVGLQRGQLGELHVWVAKREFRVQDVGGRDAGLNLASCLSWTISCSNLQLTCTPPLSAFSCNAPILADTDTSLRRIYVGQNSPHVYTLSIEVQYRIRVQHKA